MRKKLEVGVIGLGKFGLQLAGTLTELGHRVIGVDTDEQHVQSAQEVLSQVYLADATNKTVLEQLRFQDLDAVAVSVGGSMETSILVTLNLQEIGVPKIIAKAVSAAHRKVLKRLGAHQVIQPEADVAIHTAHRLVNPGMLDLLPVGGGVLVQENVVDAWEGKSLLSLNLRNNSSILVAAVKRVGENEYRFVPDPNIPFGKGDKVLLIGKQAAVLALKT